MSYNLKYTGEELESILDSVKDKVDKEAGKGLSSNDFTDEDKEKLDSLENYDDSELSRELTELSAELGNKQNTISDLENIREGAKKGATALQSVPEGYATKEYVDEAIKDIPQGGGETNEEMLRILAGQSANFVYEDIDGKIHSIKGGVSYNWADSRKISDTLKKIWYMSFAPDGINMQSAFKNAINLEEIYAKPILPARLNNGSYVEVLSGFFESCGKMKDFDFIKYWDVSHVTHLASMFNGTSAQTYPVENWNTASLIKMNGVFGNILTLKYLDLSKWDTSNVDDMTNFVFECHNIETLGLPSIPSGLPYAVILGYGTNTLQNIFMAEGSLIKGSIMFNTSPQLTVESVQTLIDHLDAESVGTLTLHKDAKARYDASNGAGACAAAVTAKGWALA